MANSISEWFGYRIFPTVTDAEQAIRDQQDERCPFLAKRSGRHESASSRPTRAAYAPYPAKLTAAARLVVCPYRTADQPDPDGGGAPAVFSSHVRRNRCSYPPRRLPTARPKNESANRSMAGGGCSLYFMDKLGGEIDIPWKQTFGKVQTRHDASWRSLGLGAEPPSADTAILEVQTMDFHGTYREATLSLTHALKLHPRDFASQLRANPNWASAGMESEHRQRYSSEPSTRYCSSSAGNHSRLCRRHPALPGSVWESWQPHWGAPKTEIRRPWDPPLCPGETPG